MLLLVLMAFGTYSVLAWKKTKTKTFLKKQQPWSPSFPGERENPTMSKITTLSERETSSRLHNTLVNSCQHVHSSPGAVFIFRLRNNSPPFFPLKMHSMVLPSNQLIRRPEPRPSWYQLILSRRKKERKKARGGVDKLSMLIDSHSWPVKCQPLPRY